MWLKTGNRILLIGQTDATQNGIYTVVAVGAPTRSTDLDVGSAACGVYVFVDEGTQWVDRAFVCISNKGSDVVGTNNLEFVQFSSRSSAMAGNGLVTGAAQELNVNVDNVTLTILSNKVEVKDQG